MTSIQNRRDELVAQMRPDFRQLYSPTHAWGDIHSFVMSLQGLVGYWPGAIDIGTPLLLDVSGNGLHLTRNGSPTVSVDVVAGRPFVPTTIYPGTADYFSHADNAKLDITGANAILAAQSQGLTMVAWFKPDVFPAGGNSSYIMGKVAAGQNSYALRISDDPFLVIDVSNDGTAITSASIDFSGAIGEWSFVAGVFSNSSNTIVPYLNLETPGTAAFASTIFNGTAPFTLGADGAGANELDGTLSHPFLCASALPQIVIQTYYLMTAPLFGRQI